MSAKTERFEMRLDQELSDKIEHWRTRNGNIPRSEAVRGLILKGLDKSDPKSVNLTDGEKLIISMIADLTKPPQNREIDTDKVVDAIYGGHLWALKWDLQGVFHDHVDSPRDVSLVLDILDMWSFIEEAVEAMSPTDRKHLKSELGHRGDDPKFLGFDGNNETDYLGIASHLIKKMNRFQRFHNRDLNSHMPTVSQYSTMIRAFEPIRNNLGMRTPVQLSLDEVKQILRRDA